MPLSSEELINVEGAANPTRPVPLVEGWLWAWFIKPVQMAGWLDPTFLKVPSGKYLPRLMVFVQHWVELMPLQVHY